MWAIAVIYKLEDLTGGTQNGEALQSLPPNTAVSNDSVNLSTDISGKDRCESKDCHSGESCDDPDCDNCFEDNCGTSDEEQPKHR